MGMEKNIAKDEQSRNLKEDKTGKNRERTKQFKGLNECYSVIYFKGTET